MNLRLRAAALLAALALAPARAQELPANVPDVPAGDATIRGRLVHADRGQVGDALVLLYSLTAAGEPGLRRTRTDAKGAFAFEGVSGDASLVYIVGTRIGGVPFGTRASFAPGEKEARLEIRVTDPTQDTSHLKAEDVRVRLGLGCTHLRVQQTHVLHNASQRVIYVPPDRRDQARPLLEAGLPAGAEGFELAVAAGADEIDRAGERLRFWGPLHPGRHEIEWSYGLPLAQKQTLHLELPQGAPKVQVLTPAGGLLARATGLRASGERELPDGRYLLQTSGAIRAGSALDLAIDATGGAAPGPKPKVEEVRLWLELDDAALDVSEEHVLQVEGSDEISGVGGAPLLCLPMPPGAQDLRFATGMMNLGPTRDPSGALALHGPLPPGQSSLALRYQLPTERGAGVTRLTRRFAGEVPLLQVLVADTGILADGPRLHRKRPIVTDDRAYVHLEAFAVGAEEEILVTLEPLPARSDAAGGLASGAVLIGALGALAFLAAPLRAAQRESATPRESAAAVERESIYRAIDALDEDLETGKVSADDHAQMRATLRARAVELMARERSEEAAAPKAATQAPACRSCGKPLQAGDRFCSRCGTARAPREDAIA
jgi:hypothetical protein